MATLGCRRRLPRFRQLQLINNETLPDHPPTIEDFLDWNLKATSSADLFTFNKPADAKEIDFLKEASVK